MQHLEIGNMRITFKTDTDLEKQHGMFEVANKAETNVIKHKYANDVVIYLIKNYENPDRELIVGRYVSKTPYWFFHDLAHAIYTPQYFVPEIKAIPEDIERAMYQKGLVLAQRYRLDKEHWLDTPELKKEGLL